MSAIQLSEIVRVIGFDPGLADTGWGVIDYDVQSGSVYHVAHGVIKTDSADPIEERVIGFSVEAEQLFRKYRLEGRVPHVCAESYLNYGRVFWNGVQTLYVMGALITLCASHSYGIELIGARESKLLIGVRDGDKKTTQKLCQAVLLGLNKAPSPLHASDALGIALARLTQLYPEFGKRARVQASILVVEPPAPKRKASAKATRVRRFAA